MHQHQQVVACLSGQKLEYVTAQQERYLQDGVPFACYLLMTAWSLHKTTQE